MNRTQRPARVIEYSINDGATWHHGKTVEAWVAADPSWLSAQRGHVRAWVRDEHGDVDHVATRVLSENDPRAVLNQPAS